MRNSSSTDQLNGMDPKISSRSPVLMLIFALSFVQALYVLVPKYLEYCVSIRKEKTKVPHTDGSKADSAFGNKNGCLPPPHLPNRLPLGIDWIRKIWRADSEQHLLAFFGSIADGYEPRNMISQYLLFGPRAYHILDPTNLEAILSTNFEGICHNFMARPHRRQH